MSDPHCAAKLGPFKLEGISMRMEFLPDGSDDCPLVRLFDFEQKEVERLSALFKKLGESDAGTSIALHEQPFVESVSDCRLSLVVGERDLGVVRTDRPVEFRCILDTESWLSAGELAAPLALDKSECDRYQWLTRHGEIQLLLSKSGSW